MLGYSEEMSENRSKTTTSARAQASGEDNLDALPMSKPSTGLYVSIGGISLALLGLLGFSLMGGKNHEEKVRAAETAAGVSEPGLSKEQQKEQKAHLERTARALAEAAAQEKPAAEAAQPAAVAPADPPPSEEADSPSPKPAAPSSPGGTASKASPPAKPAGKAGGKKSPNLDFGADIASALK